MISVQELIRICEERGLKVVINDAGVPVLRGNRDEVTPALLDAMRRYKPKIVEYLAEQSKKNVEVTI